MSSVTQLNFLFPADSPQSMYSALPGLLDGNPFSEGGQLRVPDGLSSILEVLKETLKLLAAFQVHPDISLQLCAYLFFFINASLFNALMERGETLERHGNLTLRLRLFGKCFGGAEDFGDTFRVPSECPALHVCFVPQGPSRGSTSGPEGFRSGPTWTS